MTTANPGRRDVQLDWESDPSREAKNAPMASFPGQRGWGSGGGFYK